MSDTTKFAGGVAASPQQPPGSTPPASSTEALDRFAKHIAALVANAIRAELREPRDRVAELRIELAALQAEIRRINESHAHSLYEAT